MRQFLVSLFLILSAAAARADSWGPYPDSRVVSPNGKHYLVARGETYGKFTFELCRRRDGVPPLPAAHAPDRYAKDPKPLSIDRDPEDPLLAKGELSHCPLQIRVLDSEPAALLFEQYAWVGNGTALACLDEKGAIRWQVALRDLFSAKECASFPQTVSSTWWYAGWWIDESRGKVVLVAEGDLLREVDLKGGAVVTPSAEVLLTRLEGGPVEDRMFALEVAGRLLPAGLVPLVRKIVQDEREPVSLRLRAAVAARRAGDDAGAEDLFLKTIPKGNAKDDREYAVHHLGEILGERAIPFLRDAMRGRADEAWNPAMRALEGLGERAVPTLLEMLAEEGETADYRGGAANVLGEIESAAALSALLKAVHDREEFVANHAVNAAIAIGAPDLDSRLAAILLEGSTQDRRLAMYFERHPCDLAVRPLLAAVGRLPAGSSRDRSWDRSWFFDALRKCTGKDFGDNVEKWRTGLGLK